MFAVLTVAIVSFATIPAIAQQAPAAQNEQQNPGKSVLENPAEAMAQMQAAAAAKIKEAAAQPTPRTPDGHTDLTGYWTPPVDLLALLSAGGRGALAANGSTTRPLVGSESQEHAGNIAGVAARKANTALRPSYKPEFQGQADKNFEKAAYSDPAYRCMPQGVPRMGAPAEIVQTPQAMYFMYAGLIPSVPNPYRIIPIDGRKHDPNADPMADGDAVGHWEGDMLIVDVVNLDPDTWLDGDGSFHDGNLHVVERLTRQGNTLRYEVTIDDPTMFTKPFSPKPTMLILAPAGQHAPEDYPCVEMDQGHLKTDERH
jgi:hypothetical protein